MRRIKTALVIGVATGLLGLGAALTAPGFLVQEQLGLQWLFSIRGPVEPPDDAVIVSIDKASSDWIRGLPAKPSRWPQSLRPCFPDPSAIDRLRSTHDIATWPRQVYGCLVDTLAENGASVIAFDIIFAEERDRADDAILADAIGRAQRVVLLQTIDRVRPTDTGNVADSGRSPTVDVLVSPTALFRDRAVAVGPFPLPRVQSKVLQFWTFKDSVGGVPTLPVVALQVHALPGLEWFFRSGLNGSADRESGTSTSGDPGTPNRLEFLVGQFLREAQTDPGSLTARLEVEAPTNDHRLLARYRRDLESLTRVYEGRRYNYINYYGPPRTIRTISLHEVFEDGAASLDLAGKAVFVGSSELSSEDQRDSFPTVYSGEFAVDSSGVEIAATTFLNLLHGKSLRPLSNLERAAVTFAFGFFAAGVACLLPGARGVVLALGFGGAYLFAGAALFGRFGLWFPLVVPLLLQLPTAVLAGLLKQYFGTLHWFETYAPRKLVRRLVRGDEFFATSTSEREVTVMFTDIADYTKLSETYPRAAIVAFLNQHFTIIDNSVEAEGGTVGQHDGDCAMAYWGALERQDDHATRACRAALAIAAAVKEDNESRLSTGKFSYRMRIGINSGEVSTGTVGGPLHATFTLTGDPVNTAKRLEQLGKTVCSDKPEVGILISAATASGISSHFDITDVGSHLLKGKSEATKVYRLETSPVGNSTNNTSGEAARTASATTDGSNR